MTWLLRRVALSFILIWIVASIVFLAIRLVPGDPAELLLSQGGVAPDPSAVSDLRHQLGLDLPLYEQYRLDMAALLRGDLGRSMEDDTPVADNVMQRLPRTLELLAAACVIAVVFGIPAGLFAALRPQGVFDRVAGLVTAVILAVPVFVLGTLLVLVFAQRLHWVAAGGYVPWSDPMHHLASLAMPALTIGAGLACAVFRMARSAVQEVARRDFVRTARAKGVSPGRILIHHVLRNALMPVVTVLALQLGSLLGGTVLVEYVFNYPGRSGLLVEAVSARDYPEVIGVILVISILFVGLNLLVDVFYAVLDPRVRS